MLSSELTVPARTIGALLRERGETVAVAEGSAGGLISAALLSVPGASAYYLGGAVVYTRQASVAWMSGAIETPHGMRGATEVFAQYLARSTLARLHGASARRVPGPPTPWRPAGTAGCGGGAIEATRQLLTQRRRPPTSPRAAVSPVVRRVLPPR
jgi:nicotinamide mononucleotide (NMN) deamidase PncC